MTYQPPQVFAPPRKPPTDHVHPNPTPQAHPQTPRLRLPPARAAPRPRQPSRVQNSPSVRSFPPTVNPPVRFLAKLTCSLLLRKTTSLTLESSDGSAVLRTPDKIYQLRQKNTSNTLFLLSPTPSSGSAEQQIAIVSTVQETVELDAVSEHPIRADRLADTGSRGRWHEMFGKGR